MRSTMPPDLRRRNGSRLLVSAVFVAVSAVAFGLDGDTLAAIAMAAIALGLAALGAMRMAPR